LLFDKGFLKKVMKGWYIPCRPDEQQGDSTSWYVSYWKFCDIYLHERFGDDWVLSPEHSLMLHAGDNAIPGQLVVRAPGGRNRVTDLIHGTSIFELRTALPPEQEVVKRNGIRVFSLSAGLTSCSSGFFSRNQIAARTVLGMVGDPSEILRLLLERGQTTIAGRLAGAFRNAGRPGIADEITKTMKAAGYNIRESDPFEDMSGLHVMPPATPPHIRWLHLTWEAMRKDIPDHFPAPPGIDSDTESYLKKVDDVYVTDAYHSLSIEGYRVSAELIDKVRSGIWNPDIDESDIAHRDAMAARGYWQAFLSVKKSVEKVLNGENAGRIAGKEHGDWYRELFAPGVAAGILKPSDLAGYRNSQVFIQQSRHIPPAAPEAREMTSELFELLADEEEPGVRAVLGHFLFAWIHPYMDGNGRMARFLMNLMLASGGYPWTVIPVESRSDYMRALEEASVQKNITPFAKFVSRLVDKGMDGEPVARIT
ncbi:MAG: Fic family protein, partial [Balneolaceae bacterium]